MDNEYPDKASREWRAQFTQTNLEWVDTNIFLKEANQWALAFAPEFAQYPRAIYRFGLPFRYPSGIRTFVQVTHYDQVVRYRARFARGFYIGGHNGYRNC